MLRKRLLEEFLLKIHIRKVYMCRCIDASIHDTGVGNAMKRMKQRKKLLDFLRYSGFSGTLCFSGYFAAFVKVAVGAGAVGTGGQVAIGTVDQRGQNQVDGGPAFALAGGAVTAFL